LLCQNTRGVLVQCTNLEVGGYRISRFDRDGGVGIVRDELLLMEIVNEFAVGKCSGIGGTGSSQSSRAKPFGGVRQRGWAGSGELIVDPPIVDPSPVTVTQQTTNSEYISMGGSLARRLEPVLHWTSSVTIPRGRGQQTFPLCIYGNPDEEMII
jgi:hypothetical protein